MTTATQTKKKRSRKPAKDMPLRESLAQGIAVGTLDPDAAHGRKGATVPVHHPDGSVEQKPVGDVYGKLWDVEIDLIDTPVDNHRAELDEARLKELMKSIEQDGLLTPIHVFHNGNDSDPRFILGSGFRRLTAHTLLGRKTIQAFVHPPATVGEIRVHQAIENLQRADLTPMEEAAALAAIAESPGFEGDVERVAAHVGRPRKWVENRLALNRLSPRVQAILLAGDITLGHAQVIARLVDYDQQEEVAGMVKRDERRRPWTSVRRTKTMVEQRLRDLSGVPWKLEAEFAGKPACSTCPHNSANALSLFEGDDEARAMKKPQCLLPSCFKEKSAAASAAIRKATNTLVKKVEGTGETDAAVKKRKMSAKIAEKAIAEREVEFIDPKKVAAAARSRVDAEAKPKTQTTAERRGAQRSQDDWKVENKHREACLARAKKVRAMLNDAIAKDPCPEILNAMIAVCCDEGAAELFSDTDYRHFHGAQNMLPKGLDKARARVKPVLDLFRAKRLSADFIVQIVMACRASQTDPDRLWPFGYEQSIVLEEVLAERFGLELPPVPSIEEFRKKPAAKKKTTTKRKAPARKPAQRPRTSTRKAVSA